MTETVAVCEDKRPVHIHEGLCMCEREGEKEIGGEREGQEEKRERERGRESGRERTGVYASLSLSKHILSPISLRL